MINRLIKNFCFIEEERDNLSFSDSSLIRLNTEDKTNQRVMLKGSKKSLDADIYVETNYIEPNALNKWLSFEIIFKEGENTPLVLPVGASLGVKIKTTAGDYWWNGAAWSVAGASDWSTDAEIRANIETLPIITIGNKKIGFKINLKTVDEDVTPEIYELKLLGEFDIETLDDLLYDSLIRLLNTQFRSTSVVIFNSGSSSISSIDLDSVLENKGYNIFDVTKVFNLSDDSLKLNNLHDSYAQGETRQDGHTFEPGIEAFSSAIPAGKWVAVHFTYVPEISVKVGQDYFESPTYPHITFTRITEVSRRGFILPATNSAGKDYVRDKENGVAVEQSSPSQTSYRFDFMLHTTPNDQFKLAKDFERFFSNNQILSTYGLDNKHSMEMVDKIDTVGNSTNNDSTDTSLSKGSFDVLGVLSYDKPSKDIPLVTNLIIDIDKI